MEVYAGEKANRAYGGEVWLPEETVEAIREQGYATAMGELEIGLMATAAPIFNYAAEPIAALSIVGPSVRIDEARLHQLAQEAQKAANTISHQLGYRLQGRS